MFENCVLHNCTSSFVCFCIQSSLHHACFDTPLSLVYSSLLLMSLTVHSLVRTVYHAYVWLLSSIVTAASFTVFISVFHSIRSQFNHVLFLGYIVVFSVFWLVSQSSFCSCRSCVLAWCHCAHLFLSFLLNTSTISHCSPSLVLYRVFRKAILSDELIVSLCSFIFVACFSCCSQFFSTASCWFSPFPLSSLSLEPVRVFCCCS